MQQSAAAQPLATIETLTADWAGSPQYLRISTQGQLQFFIDYNPNAAEEPFADSKYLECKLQYSHEPADLEDVTDNTFTWRTYTEEQDLGGGVSEAFVRIWRVYSNDTEYEDRDPTFSRPLIANVARIAYREVGVANFGTVTIRGAALSLN